MQNTRASTTGFMLELGTLDQIKTCVHSNPDVWFLGSGNSHIHLPPNFSAFETVEQAVTMAHHQNIDVLGVGNYYDFSIYRTFAQQTRLHDIFPLFGTEIIALETDLQQQGIRVNDPANPGKYYLCGKGITRFEPISEKAADLINTIRINDTLRMREMTARLEQLFSRQGIETQLNDQAVIARVVRRHGCEPDMVTLQERHLAQAFQEVFFEQVPPEQRIQVLTDILGNPPKANTQDSVGIQNEFRSHLMKAGKPCFVPETFINLKQAKELILELGGIPCYPVLADGAQPLCEYETPLDTLVQTLRDNNYSLVEFIPIRNQPDVLADYVTAIRRAGIAVVAGTEHNTLDLLPIEPGCIEGQPVPDNVQAIFREGICVLAAHAFLSAHGECGFVDAGNNPHPKYNDPHERIERFRQIGAVVLDKYFQAHKAQRR
ncbi:MAG: hypothetical protein JW860_03650 [Sedimentisphaerales bacterium]|nr:hypothetical protein [Sedimentisphaerales bacterium]